MQSVFLSCLFLLMVKSHPHFCGLCSHGVQLWGLGRACPAWAASGAAILGVHLSCKGPTLTWEPGRGPSVLQRLFFFHYFILLQHLQKRLLCVVFLVSLDCKCEGPFARVFYLQSLHRSGVKCFELFCWVLMRHTQPLILSALLPHAEAAVQ